MKFFKCVIFVRDRRIFLLLVVEILDLFFFFLFSPANKVHSNFCLRFNRHFEFHHRRESVEQRGENKICKVIRFVRATYERRNGGKFQRRCKTLRSRKWK